MASPDADGTTPPESGTVGSSATEPGSDAKEKANQYSKNGDAASGGGDPSAKAETAPTPSNSGAIDANAGPPKLVQVDPAASAGDATAADVPPSEESIVLSYLRKYGLANAAFELQTILEKEKKELDSKQAKGESGSPGNDANADNEESKKRKRVEGEEDAANEESATGGKKDEDAKEVGETTKKEIPSIDYDVTEEAVEILDEEGIMRKDSIAGAGDVASVSTAGPTTETAVSSANPPGSSPNNTNSADATNNILHAATGGGFGYDLDAAPAIVGWGAGFAPPSLKNQTISRYLLEGRSLDEVNFDAESDHQVNEEVKEMMKNLIPIRDEARRYIEGFTSLVTWILTLPDDPANPIITTTMESRNPFGTDHQVKFAEERSKIVEENSEKEDDTEKTAGESTATPEAMDVDDEKPCDDTQNNCATEQSIPPSNRGLVNLISHSLAAATSSANNHTNACQAPAQNTLSLPLGAIAKIIPPTSSATFQHDLLLLPPSTKHELLTLSFPLLVHTYCELLSCGLEHTARALLDTYRHLYEPAPPTEIAELEKCRTIKSIVELNEDVLGQSSLQAEMRTVNTQIGASNKKKSELEDNMKTLRRKLGQSKLAADEKRKTKHALTKQEQQIAKLNETISRLCTKIQELTNKNNLVASKLASLPFLRRARTLKWNITISTSAFGALTGFVSSRDDLLPMSALLQSRCHLIVERRDPMPFCPPAVLQDMVLENGNESDGKKGGNAVRWAAPAHSITRALEAGEDVSGLNGSQPHQKLAGSILAHSEALPFPKFRLEEGEDREADARSAVEFNRALLINGFRRLEALELKREYESGLLRPSFRSNSKEAAGKRDIADPLSPSVLLGSLCSSAEADSSAGFTCTSPWRESNIGITAASICPPDGRKVAVGCDDAAVRIWSMDRSANSPKSNRDAGSTSLGEPSMVLLGHKNGFPVFDVDWTRNGRTLLSAGGDGTVRLWDTQAVGPYGKLSNVMQQKSGPIGNTSKHAGGATATSLNTVMVPGDKPEPMVEIGGAALAVYQGHAPSTPVWSVSSAPCGYYFASAGSDYTARIWATDRCTPIRILSGHISPSVNCVAWHPNCNYVVTASDDKTCRMWDVQTGRCVRLLSGSTRGLNLVRVSPSGRYLAGAGYGNVVRMWDLGNGRMVNEFRASSPHDSSAFCDGLIQSMAFSTCGAALAVAGEDCAMRIWDVRGAGSHLSNPDYFAATRGPTATSSISDGFARVVTPSQLERLPANEQFRPGTRVPSRVFKTNGVSVLDVKYTKRNLLLAVGNYFA